MLAALLVVQIRSFSIPAKIIIIPEKNESHF